jgi:hypothetical protein
MIDALAGLPPSFRADPLELDAPATMGGAQLAAIERAARTYSHWWPL